MLNKKSLGQHFLRDEKILAKIAAAARLAPTDVVLEVGPGEGSLTELLLQKAARVIAVEKDDRLVPLLRQKFGDEIAVGRLELIHADILVHHQGSTLMVYKVVANLPYYITGAFLRKFLGGEHQPSSMTLLLQKEAAKRIVASASPRLRRASAHKESILSISVKCYGEPKIVGIVKAGSFSPPPKVDSAIVTIENISKDFFSSRLNLDERGFFAIVKRGFAHPRKLLASNLGVRGTALEERGISAKARAEDLTLAEWRTIADLSRSTK